MRSIPKLKIGALTSSKVTNGACTGPKLKNGNFLRTVECVRAALERRLKEVEWMSDSTRERALQKMHHFKVKIGYPDKWIDYSNVRPITLRPW